MMLPNIRAWRESSRCLHSYYEVRPQMPRIPDEHLQSVVFVYPSEVAASKGERAGGTGFVVNYPTAGGFRARYVVTNQHVVDNGGHWVRLNRVGGHHVEYIPVDMWTSAPDLDDFAVAPLSLPEGVQPLELSLDSLALTRQESENLKVGPGDETYMVGRFVAHGGRVTNNPIARFGSISLMPDPDEPIVDGRGNAVEAYLVEMRSHAGFSGSPVFLLIPHNSFRGRFGDTAMDDHTDRFRLLGIDTGHMPEYLPVERVDHRGRASNEEQWQVLHNRDIAIVAPIWKLVDLLEREDFVEERNRLGREWAAAQGQGVAPAVSDLSLTSEDSEFDQFRNLAGRLVQVSKKEIDEKRERS